MLIRGARDQTGTAHGLLSVLFEAVEKGSRQTAALYRSPFVHSPSGFALGVPALRG